VTQVATKSGAIRVPAETVLTCQLDSPSKSLRQSDRATMLSLEYRALQHDERQTRSRSVSCRRRGYQRDFNYRLLSENEIIDGTKLTKWNQSR